MLVLLLLHAACFEASKMGAAAAPLPLLIVYTPGPALLLLPVALVCYCHCWKGKVGVLEKHGRDRLALYSIR